MVSYKHILVTRRGCAVWITLDRPEAMNSLTLDMMREIDVALKEAENDKGVKALVIMGSGDNFCAGADLKAMGGGGDNVANIKTFMAVANPVLGKIENSPLPVIAAVRGAAMAGGLELLLCCDIIIAEEGARIGDIHANLGLVPGGGSSVRLTKLIGPSRAKEMLFTGEIMPLGKLEDIGLINIIAQNGELEKRVEKFLQKLSRKSPLALGRMKQMVHNTQIMEYHDCLKKEAEICLEHAGSYDAKEGILAFTERRSPDFKGT